MPAITATAPAKVILAGEHAVVYNQPGIAVPVASLRSKATATANIGKPADEIIFAAKDLEQTLHLAQLGIDHPFKVLVEATKNHLKIEHFPSLTLTIRSEIPPAAGLGSGASVSIAMASALGRFVGVELSPEQLSAICYEVEKIHHGTPSGIDNSVIAYQKPVYFIKDKSVEFIPIHQPFTLLIINSGLPATTFDTVRKVREAYANSPEEYAQYFKNIGTIVEQIKHCITEGNFSSMGSLMNENHFWLQKLGVSIPLLDTLCQTAIQHGALGAKLSGGGGGGNIIALVEPELIQPVTDAVMQAGARNCFATLVSAREE